MFFPVRQPTLGVPSAALGAVNALPLGLGLGLAALCALYWLPSEVALSTLTLASGGSLALDLLAPLLPNQHRCVHEYVHC